MKQRNDKVESLVTQVLNTAASLERGMDSALSFTRGITFSEYRLLRSLLDADSGLTRVALARAVSASPSGVTRALRPLEKLGYVKTEKNDRDARQSLAVLTEGGRELLSDATGILADFFADLGVGRFEPAKVRVLKEMLTRLASPQ